MTSSEAALRLLAQSTGNQVSSDSQQAFLLTADEREPHAMGMDSVNLAGTAEPDRPPSDQIKPWVAPAAGANPSERSRALNPSPTPQGTPVAHASADAFSAFVDYDNAGTAGTAGSGEPDASRMAEPLDIDTADTSKPSPSALSLPASESVAANKPPPTGADASAGAVGIATEVVAEFAADSAADSAANVAPELAADVVGDVAAEFTAAVASPEAGHDQAVIVAALEAMRAGLEVQLEALEPYVLQLAMTLAQQIVGTEFKASEAYYLQALRDLTASLGPAAVVHQLALSPGDLDILQHAIDSTASHTSFSSDNTATSATTESNPPAATTIQSGGYDAFAETIAEHAENSEMPRAHTPVWPTLIADPNLTPGTCIASWSLGTPGAFATASNGHVDIGVQARLGDMLALAKAA